MGNVTLPTPVFLAGGALCLLAGYLVGSVVGPDTPDRTTAEVVSYTTSTSRLCLKGDDFRFVSIRTTGKLNGKTQQQVVIYGDVVD